LAPPHDEGAEAEAAVLDGGTSLVDGSWALVGDVEPADATLEVGSPPATWVVGAVDAVGDDATAVVGAAVVPADTPLPELLQAATTSTMAARASGPCTPSARSPAGAILRERSESITCS
jgi:hypothetical protein